MHAVIFAGGSGQRLWPLSRKSSPKQFAALVDSESSKSSIQLAVERLLRLVDPSRVFVATHRAYSKLLREQLPELGEHNYILEPCRRDVAAAVALAFFSLEKDGVTGPVIFQWSDHYVRHSEALIRLVGVGKSLVESNTVGLVIIAQEPRFANDNLGWIELGQEGRTIDGVPYHAFGEWVYRPEKNRCQQMFASRQWVWNTGHFVTSVEFMTSSFRSRAPGLAARIEEIVSYRGSPEERSKLEELYPQLPHNSFDEVILTQIPRDQACLLKADLGWVDPGNLNALKEALQASPEDTVTRGNVVDLATKDTFVFNGTDKPVVVMGVSDIIVVELQDVTLVVDKGSVRDLGRLLQELERRGLGHLL